MVRRGFTKTHDFGESLDDESIGPDNAKDGKIKPATIEN